MSYKRLLVAMGMIFSIMSFLVFIISLITIFALRAALTDRLVTTQIAQKVAAYYKADAEAETLLALIDERLCTIDTSLYDGNHIERALQNLDAVETQCTPQGEIWVYYEVPLSNEEVLNVALTIDEAKRAYCIKAWQVKLLESKKETSDEGLLS